MKKYSGRYGYVSQRGGRRRRTWPVVLFCLLTAAAGVTVWLLASEGKTETRGTVAPEMASLTEKPAGTLAATPTVIATPQMGEDSWMLRLVNAEAPIQRDLEIESREVGNGHQVDAQITEAPIQGDLEIESREVDNGHQVDAQITGAPIQGDLEIELREVGNGHQVDARIAEALTAMLSDAKAQGLSPMICSAYRSQQKQRQLFEAQVEKQRAQGLSDQEADAEARRVVAYPGTSEHQTGLAVDIVSLDNQVLDESQVETAENIWLRAHCAQYGFVVRYPKDKEDITGVIYEPWHFRYVGKEAAGQMAQSGECLEEYLEQH